MTVLGVLRTLAVSAVVASCSATSNTESVDHVHHHHHHHHHHHKHNATAQTCATPPCVESNHAAHMNAQRAHDAAETAKDAAALAKQVADHTLKSASNAKEALKNAHDALHEARVESKGLSPEQEEKLRMAESKLKTASDGFPHSTSPLSADERQALQNRVDDLQAKLKTEEPGKAEEKQMEEELKALREQLGSLDKKGKDKSVEEMDAELKQLQDMLKSLEEAKANTPAEDAQSRGELEIEIQHLRESIKRLENVGAVTAKIPEAKKVEPQKADLRYRMKLHRPRPKVQLTPLVGIQKKKRSRSTSTMSQAAQAADEDEDPPVQSRGIDVDTDMPYGELEPFGREDTAQELTEASIRESDAMVDQLERAEVSEEKRAVFRALTRLRGAAITSFDGVARSQTGNIDEYNKVHKWRNTHPLAHLADEESDVSKWAFPDNADF